VTKRLGETLAVDGLSFAVPAGSICGFLGPNGAGKSTTVRLIMAILGADAGQVTVLGGPPAAARARVGYLPETRGLYPKMRVEAYLSFCAKLKGATGQAGLAWARAGLADVGLERVGRWRCEALSKGMQQQVQLLAARARDPALLVLDEPFSGLDPLAVERLAETLRRLRAEGCTLLLSTHALALAETLCDHIVLIDRGRKLLDAPLAQVRAGHGGGALEVALWDPHGALDVPPDVGVGAALGEGRFVVTLAVGVEAQAALQAVVARNAVRQVGVRAPNLHEVFVNLVGAARAGTAAQPASAGEVAA
jgi:ABC-2 type transport system ATP-binding protein